MVQQNGENQRFQITILAQKKKKIGSVRLTRASRVEAVKIKLQHVSQVYLASLGPALLSATCLAERALQSDRRRFIQDGY